MKDIKSSYDAHLITITEEARNLEYIFYRICIHTIQMALRDFGTESSF